MSFVEFSKANRPTISAEGQMEPGYVPSPIDAKQRVVEGFSGELHAMEVP